MIQEGLYTYLSSDTDVSAIVSTRVYPMAMPQQAFTDTPIKPCLVYYLSDIERQVRYSGTDTLVAADLVVECYANSYKQAQQLAAAVRDRLLDYTGTLAGTGSPVVSHNVQRIFLEREADGVFLDQNLYRVMQDYRIWYDEASA